MIDDQHIIQKQILEFEFPKEEMGLDWQQSASDLYYRKILPRLEEVFSQYGSGDHFIRIDRLDIDLGELEMNSWETQLLERLSTKAKEALNEIATYKENASVEVQPQHHTVWETFLFFLERGYFPWWQAEGQSVKAWERVLLETFDSQWPNLKQLLQKNTNTAERMVYHCSKEWVARCLIQLEKEVPEKAKSLWKVIKRLDPGLRSANAEKRTRILQIVCLLQGGAIEKTAQYWISTFEEDKRKVILEEIEDISSETRHKSHHVIFKNIKENLLTIAKKSSITSESPMQSFGALSKDENVHANGPDFQKQLLNGLVSEPKSVNSLEEEVIYIQNAGLILLHPFLPAYFRELGLVEKGQFKGKEAQKRAILLLHFAGYGNHKPEENLLVFNKLLCGLNIEETVNPDLQLLVSEVEETEKLLHSVINNWSILGNTSIESLRHSFILRLGKLSNRGDNWHLVVESSSKDILLQKLPWGIAKVKLPWNSHLLSLNWN